MARVVTCSVAPCDRGTKRFTMMLAFQVTGSVALVIAVLWWMWRLPEASPQAHNWAPLLALSGVWMGLVGLVTAVGLWWVPHHDRWLAAVMLLLVPGSIATGLLVLWVHRHDETLTEPVNLQRLQAKIAIAMGALAAAMSYGFVMQRVGG